jgi:hypothetical protein
MTGFWNASGHLLLDRDEDGRLVVTDEFLKAYLARPELVPPEDACPAERALHARLLAAHRVAVAPAEVAALADVDARENWQAMLAFRDRLLAAPSLEAAYVAMIRQGVSGTPPMFLDQLVQLILRNILDGCEDAHLVRAAELFFRPQRVTLHEGRILLADEETVEGHERARPPSPLLAMLGGPAVASLDILKPASAAGYWARSDAHDMVLDLGGDPSGRAAIGRVITLWIGHLLGVAASVEPLERIEDADWRWFVGLDPEGTRIGNALWRGERLPPEAMGDLLALYRLKVQDAAALDPRLEGRPVYLILAMDGARRLRLKPQNLVVGLPLAEPA